METWNGIPTVYAPTRTDWRNWLAKNHRQEKSVWLIIYKKESGTSSVYYPEAVDEALCFGWIDSKGVKRDATSYYQFFTRRNPKSNWSRINKDKVAYLVDQGLMTSAGLEMVELAKRTGTWNALDEVENIIVPDDLQLLLDQNPKARNNWNGFARSAKRGILEWILNAKKPGTRQKRIEQTVQLAAQNIKANQYQPKS